MIVVDTNVIHYCWVRGVHTDIAQAVRQRKTLTGMRRFYDAEFVALASALSVPLVTADKAVLKAFPDRAMTMGSFSSQRSSILYSTYARSRVCRTNS